MEHCNHIHVRLNDIYIWCTNLPVLSALNYASIKFLSITLQLRTTLISTRDASMWLTAQRPYWAKMQLLWLFITKEWHRYAIHRVIDQYHDPTELRPKTQSKAKSLELRCNCHTTAREILKVKYNWAVTFAPFDCAPDYIILMAT